jgi:hypothetical protein
MSQMDGLHQDVRNALVPLMLEVVLSQPEDVVAVLVHAPRDGLGLVEDRRQVLVRVAPLVGRRGHLAHVAQIHVPGIDGRELADHVGVLRERSLAATLFEGQGNRVSRGFNPVRGVNLTTSSERVLMVIR